MTTKQMSVQDALWLTMDRPNNLMVVDGAMMIAGIPELDAVRAVIEQAVERFPVLHRKPVPSGTGWAWEDDPEFDLANHVTHHEFDEPVDISVVQEFVAQQRSVELPKHGPLWQSFLVSPVMHADGTEGAAVVTRFHHSIADGVRLTQLLLGMCEAEDVEVSAKVAREGTANDGGLSGEISHAVDSARHLAGGAASAVAHTAGGVLAGAAHAVRHPLSTAVQAPSLAASAVSAGYHGVEDGLDLVTHPDRLMDILEDLGVEGTRAGNDIANVTKIAVADSDQTVWSGEPGVEKAVAWATPISLKAIKEFGRPRGATVNDVMIAGIAGGLRRYLSERNAEANEVTWMVPVNLKPFEDNLPPDLGNYFALVFLPMPLDTDDADARLEQAHARMQRIKSSDEAVLTFGLQRVVSSSPSQVAFFLTNFFANKAVGVLTNVPGPRGPMTFAGVPVEQVVGFAPCSGNQPMTATIFSYNGGVTVGFATDAALVPDPAELSRYVVDNLAEMGVDVTAPLSN